jgi:hypothetical protein
VYDATTQNPASLMLKTSAYVAASMHAVPPPPLPPSPPTPLLELELLLELLEVDPLVSSSQPNAVKLAPVAKTTAHVPRRTNPFFVCFMMLSASGVTPAPLGDVRSRWGFAE